LNGPSSTITTGEFILSTYDNSGYIIDGSSS